MTITAAADGSALGNPGPNGWAWYIDDANWAAGGSPHGTNNQGELRAVLELLVATAGIDEKLMIECDSRYVIDSVTKWMPGWKRKGWRKSDGGPVLNRDLLEGIDEAIRGRDVEFTWVKGHAGHPLNEAADERANGAAKAYQQKQEPNRGPGFTLGTSAAAPAPVEPAAPVAPVAEPLWAEASDLLDGLDTQDDDPIELRLALTADEHARLRGRAQAQGISLEDALRRLI
ncbi:ribonuclease H [Microbacterium sp. NPDC076768]|uniref:ribonuclease H family protein n=1 Tax=Microbacterium sp. NPDC076768 TaxID=3154858 RepID=UPI0034273C8B